MGGELGAASGDGVPRFLVVAHKDPAGANLDRVQVVKGWLDADGATHERVFDVAWSGERQPGADGKLPAVGSTVDLETARYANSIGAVTLSTLWEDPSFEAGGARLLLRPGHPDPHPAPYALRRPGAGQGRTGLWPLDHPGAGVHLADLVPAAGGVTGTAEVAWGGLRLG